MMDGKWVAGWLYEVMLHAAFWFLTIFGGRVDVACTFLVGAFIIGGMRMIERDRIEALRDKDET